jgi:chemotaxis-related protein WspB
MQVLVLEAGGQRYAVPTRGVEEVVPFVPVRAVPGAPAAVAGVIAWRGRIVPVVDLGRLLQGAASAPRLSTRIAVCNLVRAGALGEEVPEERRRVGLLAEGLTRITEVDPSAPGNHPGPRTPETSALGAICSEGSAVVQVLAVDRLLPPEVIESLVRSNEEAPA